MRPQKPHESHRIDERDNGFSQHKIVSFDFNRSKNGRYDLRERVTLNHLSAPPNAESVACPFGSPATWDSSLESSPPPNGRASHRHAAPKIKKIVARTSWDSSLEGPNTRVACPFETPATWDSSPGSSPPPKSRRKRYRTVEPADPAITTKTAATVTAATATTTTARKIEASVERFRAFLITGGVLNNSDKKFATEIIANDPIVSYVVRIASMLKEGTVKVPNEISGRGKWRKDARSQILQGVVGELMRKSEESRAGKENSLELEADSLLAFLLSFRRQESETMEDSSAGSADFKSEMKNLCRLFVEGRERKFMQTDSATLNALQDLEKLCQDNFKRLFDQMSLQDKELIKMEEAIISKAEGEEKILVELWNELRYYWDKRMKFMVAGQTRGKKRDHQTPSVGIRAEEERRSAEPNDYDDHDDDDSDVSRSDSDDWITARVSSQKGDPVTSKVPASLEDERSSSDSGVALIDDDCDDGCDSDSDCDWFTSIGASADQGAPISDADRSPQESRNLPAATRAPFVSSTPILKKNSAFDKRPFLGSSTASSLSSVFSEDMVLLSSGADESREGGRFSLISSISACHGSRENGRQTRLVDQYSPASSVASFSRKYTKNAPKSQRFFSRLSRPPAVKVAAAFKRWGTVEQ